ncbi:MAG: hypothetical protein QOF14_323 [Hyphomicrobiales bacterium]|jgi:hypothetical protein|nr:hypothetical protein [Hyphomicrobiales bacterium]
MLICSWLLLEFAVRHHWCLHPAASLDEVASAFGLSGPELQERLSYIENLGYRTICAHGIYRLARTNSCLGTLVGFPTNRPPINVSAEEIDCLDGNLVL